jgi:hypothetical protein
MSSAKPYPQARYNVYGRVRFWIRRVRPCSAPTSEPHKVLKFLDKIEIFGGAYPAYLFYGPMSVPGRTPAVRPGTRYASLVRFISLEIILKQVRFAVLGTPAGSFKLSLWASPDVLGATLLPRGPHYAVTPSPNRSQPFRDQVAWRASLTSSFCSLVAGCASSSSDVAYATSLVVEFLQSHETSVQRPCRLWAATMRSL